MAAEDMQQELQALFPLLDTALIAAIANESDDIESAKEILEVLNAEAVADGLDAPVNDLHWSETSEELAGSTATSSALSLGALEDLNLDDAGDLDHEALSFLVLSFPKQKLANLKIALRKCNGDVVRAVDELLNKELLDQEKEIEGLPQSGTVDDLFVGDGLPRRKGKKKKHVHDTSPTEDESVQNGSSWERFGIEVEWLTKHLHLPREKVTSAYHAASSSLPAALRTLLSLPRDEASEICAREDYIQNLVTLERSHGMVTTETCTNILVAAHGDMETATSIANILQRSATAPRGSSTTSSATVSGTSTPRKTPATTQTKSYAAASLIDEDDIRNPAQVRALAQEYAAKRDAAYRQAALAFKRGKSDHLLGGATSYYSDLGRSYDAKFRKWQQLAATSHVASNSTANRIDLHGVSVQEALVITKEAVTQWWSRTKVMEYKTHDVGAGALWIITGVGNHSEGGEARLGPAVRRWLERDGWVVKGGGKGSLVVTGVVKMGKK
ncbi:hypothetical protein SAICODRAFT_6741 [Saitoella complicata NRRL Y-17804]|nr:uncharacterized protein SAICODRAFT_6741 [Saitoella complicata NRRL Y-17804]ODQ53960.1 hypothetical protein SAICODRAFT_6741 [Saitoella complicata NRRL Y-17804]